MKSVLLAVAAWAWALPAAAHGPDALDSLRTMASGEVAVPAVIKIVEVRAAIPVELARRLYASDARPLPVFPGRPCPEPLCTGDLVVTGSGLSGTVAGSFPDGRISVRVPGYSQNGTYPRGEVAVTWGCNSDSCVGDPVSLENGLVGTLMGIFPDGRLSVRVPGYDRFGTYAAGQVSGVRRCSGELCVDAPVATTHGQAGVVFAVFRDGRFAVRVPGYDRLGIYSRSQLARREGCSQGLCVGAGITTESGQSGAVEGIFPDGRFAVRVAGYERFGVYARSQLATPGCS